MRLPFVVLLLPLACGPLESRKEELSAPEVRCTTATLQPGWECCDDGGGLCTAQGPVTCEAHRWRPMTQEDCLRIENDPRRPEMRTFPGTLCQRDSSGDYPWCPGPARQERVRQE